MLTTFKKKMICCIPLLLIFSLLLQTSIPVLQIIPLTYAMGDSTKNTVPGINVGAAVTPSPEPLVRSFATAKPQPQPVLAQAMSASTCPSNRKIGNRCLPSGMTLASVTKKIDDTMKAMAIDSSLLKDVRADVLDYISKYDIDLAKDTNKLKEQIKKSVKTVQQEKNKEKKQNVLKVIGTMIVNFAEGAFDYLWDNLWDVWDILMNPGKVIDMFESLFTNIKSLITNITQIDWIEFGKQVAKSVLAPVFELIEAIKDEINNFAKIAYQAGKAIMSLVMDYIGSGKTFANLASVLSGLKIDNFKKDNDKKVDLPVAKNMSQFFELKFGKAIKNVSQKTSKIVKGATVYKITGKTENEFLKKGDQYYLDTLHYDHIEVFDSRNNVKAVLNLDGKLNLKKTETALKEGRKIP